MACNGITNVTAQLAIDVTSLIENEALASAAAQGLGELLGLYEEATHITRGYNYVILWVGCWVGVTLYKTGELSCTDFRPNNTAETAAQIQTAAEQIVNSLTGMALQVKLAQLIGQLCPVESVERAANGAVVMTVNL